MKFVCKWRVLLCWLLLVLLFALVAVVLWLLKDKAEWWLLLIVAILCIIGAIAIVLAINRWLKKVCKHVLKPWQTAKPTKPSQTYPSAIYKRPDPMIYSQEYLMAQGLAVTWNNPDIHLELGGKEVPSSSLIKNTDYMVVANVWNGSQEAPAPHMPVRFSFLSFGAGGMKKTFLGETFVDLPAKGAAGLPAVASVPWRTPDKEGHYCLRVELLWPDDKNPANNVGQENTNVKALNSPNAKFVFPVGNDTDRSLELRLEADAYQIPPLQECDQRVLPATAAMTRDEAAERYRRALATHGRAMFPVPDGWTVTIEPSTMRLAAGEERDVTVDITAPDGFTGTQGLNVNTFDGDRLFGGVTLYVHS